MSHDAFDAGRKRKRAQPDNGPYVLRPLIEDLPLSSDASNSDVHITCVEFWESNVYVGTSASEILHFVEIPSDPADTSDNPAHIIASRLEPTHSDTSTSAGPGIQQILLLPKVNKACILCNGLVTFYSLPELSPVFNSTVVRGCTWIGGLDLNKGQDGSSYGDDDGTITILLSLNKKIRVVRIGEEPRAIRSIEYAGSTVSVRRDAFACVADSRSYALLDVNRQLKIPLFPISSLDESSSASIGGRVEDISGGAAGNLSRSQSSAHASRAGLSEDRGHARSTSLGTFINAATGQHGRRGGSRDNTGRDTPDLLLREASPVPTSSPQRQPRNESSPARDTASEDKTLPAVPSARTSEDQNSANARPSPVYLKPHVLSPSPQEFLLLTGTEPKDPGVGIFVNLEGDVTRSTLEFDRYPGDVVVDGRGEGVDLSPANANDDEEGYVLATMDRDVGDGTEYGLEIQRWDLNPEEGGDTKSWLPIREKEKIDEETLSDGVSGGIRTVIGAGSLNVEEVVDRLCLKRFRPFGPRSTEASTSSLQSTDSRTAKSLEQVSGERDLFEPQDIQDEETLPRGWEQIKATEERQIARRLGDSRCRIVVWSGNHVWWLVRNPLTLRLEADLLHARAKASTSNKSGLQPEHEVKTIIDNIRGREARSEAEFISLGYIRQYAGLMIFIEMLQSQDTPSNSDLTITEEALLDGVLDPRVVLAMTPKLRHEVVQAKSGIWIYGGISDLAESQMSDLLSPTNSAEETVQGHILLFFRRFLAAWRRKKGFGSIADEAQIFQTVDAALLIVLLELDKDTPKGPVKANSVRAELNELIDNGLDNFERAVAILESYDRLFVLSRLYQSRRMSREVLATWKQILEGKKDAGGEFQEGEQMVRGYLSKLSNQALVQEYGVWLAARNSKLGVRVFADDRSKVKFEPTEVVALLREGAPGAVKDYLEFLVFGKNHKEYVNDLINYYMDIVIDKLQSSEAAQTILAQSYQTYRALRPPKPTYYQFVADNEIDEDWWQSRLRLLQLLGGNHDSTSQYDVSTIRARIEPFKQNLVPETIILDGGQSLHQEALKLLTHGLGDYDTAIKYCLLGGSSIYHPMSGSIVQDSLPSREEQGTLFGYLLAEFLQIEDISDRVEQTGSLLERFGAWLDVGYVLALIPDSWSIELVSGFLISALRRIVREKSATLITKSLSGAENLKINAEMISKVDSVGPTVDT